MKRLAVGSVVVGVGIVIAACGDDGSAAMDGAPGGDSSVAIDAAPGPDAISCSGVTFDSAIGFAMPTEITRANEEVQGEWTDVGLANWSCLGAASDDVPPSSAVALSGTVEDFQAGTPVENATVSVFGDSNVLGTPLDTTTSGINGAYSLTLPAGTKRPTFAVTGQGSVATYRSHVEIGPSTSQSLDVRVVSELTANALPAFVGATRTPTSGLGAWAMRDCDGRTVSNAIATVSAAPACTVPVTGGVTYYFSAGTSSLPVRHSQQASTAADGLFMVIEMEPVNTAYVQVWGYVPGQVPGVDPIRQLAEIPVVVPAGSYLGDDLEPMRVD